MKKQNKVAVIGGGTVGKATARRFRADKCYDKQLTNDELKELKDYDYIFLCLPTTTEDGIQDLQIIRNYIRDISAVSTEPVIVIRSTVLPGTAKALRTDYLMDIISFPEFLTEDIADEDVKKPDFILLGIDRDDLKKPLTDYLRNIYKRTEIIITDTITAELAKYAANTFFVTKVVFANEMYDYAQRFGADYDIVKYTMYKNRYIGSNHLDIFHKKYRGAAGKCLMKDMNAFANHTPSDFFRFIDNENMRLLRPNGKNKV